MNTVILTSSVTPFTNVRITNPVQRLAEVLAAVVMWKHTAGVSRIIVVDGSGFTPPDNIGVEWMALNTKEICRRWGKGRSEAELITAAVDKFQPESFWKITGRLFVSNFAKLCNVAESTQMAATPNSMGIDTRCFYATRWVWDTRLEPLTAQINDRHSRTFIERVYCDGSEGIREPLTPMPQYVGIGGTNGNRLHFSYPQGILDRAYERANRWLGKDMPQITAAPDGRWMKG